MFNAKISFNLIIVTSSWRRFLSTETTGTGLQNGVAQGTYSQNSQMSDFLAKFDWESDGEVVDYSQLKIDNLKLIEANGNSYSSLIEIPNSVDKVISNCLDNKIEDEYGKNAPLYLFIQDSNRRRLKVSTVNIDGTIERNGPIDRNFTLKTKDDNKDVDCTLSKNNVTTKVKLKCNVENLEEFKLNEDKNYKSANDKGEAYMAFTVDKTIYSKYSYNSGSSYSASSFIIKELLLEL